MTKKNYLIIGLIALFFIVIITVILLNHNDKEEWTTDILKAQTYQITMTDCNGREKMLNNNTLNILSDKWSVLQDNGPWTGNSNQCYKTVTISYETNGIIKSKEILLIDETSIALITVNNSVYYTNAQDIIIYLNNLFTK